MKIVCDTAKPKQSKSTLFIGILLFVNIISMVAIVLYFKGYQEKIDTYAKDVKELNSVIAGYQAQVEGYEIKIQKLNDKIESLEESRYYISENSNIKMNNDVMSADNESYQLTTEKVWDPANYEVTNITEASEEQISLLIDEIIRYRFGSASHHPAQNISKDLVSIEAEYGISATSILAIMTWESGFCDGDYWSDEFMWSNNVCGVMDGSHARYFNSINECILYVGELLSTTYIETKGLDSMEEIGLVYCDENWSPKIADTTAMYNEWLCDIINLSNAQ